MGWHPSYPFSLIFLYVTTTDGLIGEPKDTPSLREPLLVPAFQLEEC
jgi:hypothetical protein